MQAQVLQQVPPRHRWRVPGLRRALRQAQEQVRARGQVPEPLRGPGPGRLLPSCRRQTVPRQRRGKPTGAMLSFVPLREICI
jgi:hypothetical protein